VDAQRTRNRQRGRGSNRRKGQNCHLKAIDECLNKLEALGKRPQASSIVTTSEGLDELCETIKGSIQCSKGYMKKCGTPIQRELFDFGIEQFDKSLELFCAAGPDRTTFLQNSPCVNSKVLTQKKYHTKCVTDIFAALDKATILFNKTLEDPNIFDLSKMSARGVSDQILDLMCCSINRFSDCSSDLITEECGPEAVKAMNTFTERTLGGSAGRICPRDMFDPPSDVCKEAMPPHGTIAKGKLADNPIGKYVLNYMNIIFNYEEPQ